MSTISFSPKHNVDHHEDQTTDSVGVLLRQIARGILVSVIGLSPLLFVPSLSAPFGYSKVMIVLVGVLLATIFFSLATLRSGTLEVRRSPLLVAFWAVALITLVASLLSGDIRDSLVGNTFSVHTAAFVALMALVATAVSFLGRTKNAIMNLYLLLGASALILSGYHFLRLLFGADFLPLNVFLSATSSPIGGWNDLALFFGLTLLLALVAIEQLPLTRSGKYFYVVVSILSLTMLMVVNFFTLWIILGAVSLVTLMYSLSKGRFRSETIVEESTETSASVLSLFLTTVIFVVSVAFLLAGPWLGSQLNSLTSISYLEVRPSFSATLDITRDVFSENAFLGIGPNKFVDAWTLYKDPSINQTIFWDTRFESGVGYLPTFLTTTGVLGAAVWIAFLLLILITGFRIVFRNQQGDRFWYFIGVSSFVGASYLWLMSILYVPGPTMLLLTAVFTGLLVTASGHLLSTRNYSLQLIDNRRLGFALVAMVMVVVVSSISLLYFSGRQYASAVMFNEALRSVQAGTSIATLEQDIIDAFEVSANDEFARQIAEYQFSKLQSLLGVQEPTIEQQQEFETAAVTGIQFAQLALELDESDPRNWFVLGRVYSVLAIAGVEGARSNASAALDEAAARDPQNPSYALIDAQVALQLGELNQAQAFAEAAVQKKPNFTDAYFVLTQVYLQQDNVAGAIDATLASIQLEPRNPARFYQLGVLYSNNDQTDLAIRAFQEAVRLDQNYANARYLLALAYQSDGRTDEAIAELEIVRDLNPDNAVVGSLITELQTNGAVPTNSPEQVSELLPAAGDSNEVLSPGDPDSPLISPVNTVTSESDPSDVFGETDLSAFEDGSIGTATEATSDAE